MGKFMHFPTSSIPRKWKAVIEREIQVCKDVPYATFGAAPNPSSDANQPLNSTAVKEAEEGDLGHQVAAAVIPTGRVATCFRRFTAGAGSYMKGPVGWLAKLAVSRWGLEALADLCVHGGHSTSDSAYKIVNTIAISLHPDDVSNLEAGLAGPPGVSFPRRSGPAA